MSEQVTDEDRADAKAAYLAMDNAAPADELTTLESHVAAIRQRGAEAERKYILDAIRSDAESWPGERAYIAMLLKRLETRGDK